MTYFRTKYLALAAMAAVAAASASAQPAPPLLMWDDTVEVVATLQPDGNFRACTPGARLHKDPMEENLDYQCVRNTPEWYRKPIKADMFKGTLQQVLDVYYIPPKGLRAVAVGFIRAQNSMDKPAQKGFGQILIRLESLAEPTTPNPRNR